MNSEHSSNRGERREVSELKFSFQFLELSVMLCCVDHLGSFGKLDIFSLFCAFVEPRPGLGFPPNSRLKVRQEGRRTIKQPLR